MREIEFRGINNETGEFVYGWYTKLQEGARIFDAIIAKIDGEFTRFYIRDAKTIGQFTGLRDKNGEKIYEGDVIHLQWIHNYTGSIEFRHGSFCMLSAEKEIIVRALGELYAENISVIGNLHQHPHLLEQKK